MLDLLLLKIADGKPLAKVERDALTSTVLRLEQGASRAQAQSQGGAGQAAKFASLLVSGDVDLAAGVINVGPYAKGKSNVKVSSGALQLRNYATVTIDLQADGDVFIGSNTGQADGTYLSIFSTIQTYNGEAFLAGDMLIGDNSASKANIKWDKANGQLKFRGGTTTQAYVDTTGAIVAGAGAVRIDASGLSIGGLSAYLQWYTATNFSEAIASLQANNSGGQAGLTFTAGGSVANPIGLMAISGASQDSNQRATLALIGDSSGARNYSIVYGQNGTFSGLTVGANAVPNTTLDVRGSATATGGVNVGTATGAATGQIKTLGGTAAHVLAVSDAATITQSNVIDFQHATSGTAGVSFGVNVNFKQHTSNGTMAGAAVLQTLWVNATDGSQQSRLNFYIYDVTTARVALTLEGSVGAPKIGFLGAAAAARASAYTQTFSTASRTVSAATASMNTPTGGTGATGGAFDTSAHRDALITSVTNLLADVGVLRQLVNALIDDQQAFGLAG